jgi:UDP-glucose 4-epimerase
MKTSSKKIMVTGVAGFLGSHLAEKLAEMNYKVIGVDNMSGGYKDNIPKNIEFFNFDCCNLDKMLEILKEVHVVYVCAATA